MGHKKKCKYHPTVENEDKKIFPKDIVAFCEQIRAFPIGRH